MKKTTSAVEEPTAYAEIGTYLHKNPGKATVKSYASVNEPLKVDSADETKQIKKIRVEVHVKEDTEVKGNQYYQKDVESIQLSDPKDNPYNTATGSNELPENGNGQPEPVSDDFKKWTKNIVDKLKDSEVVQYVLMTAIGIVAALALGVALVR